MKATLPKVPKRFEVKPNKQAGVLMWDNDNAYPQRLWQIINASPTADVCNSVYTDFIIGNGFVNGDVVVNYKGQTANEVLRLAGADFGRFGGFALHCNFNANGKVTQVQHVPLEYLRFVSPQFELDSPERICLYPDWEKYKKANIEKKYQRFYDFFGDKIPEDVIGYTGQIFYYSNEGYRVYPRPKADAIMEYAVIESQIPVFNLNALANSFNPSAILVTQGEFEDEKEEQDFHAELREFQGPENPNKIMHIQVNSKEEMPELLNVPQNGIADLWTKTEETAETKIQRVYGIPSMLIGKETAGKLGSTNEILEAYTFYNIRTANERNVLSEAFRKIFANFRTPVNADWKIIELKYIEGANTEASLAEKIDVGTVVAINQMLSSKDLTWAEKVYFAKIIYNVTLQPNQPNVD